LSTALDSSAFGASAGGFASSADSYSGAASYLGCSAGGYYGGASSGFSSA